MPATKEKAKHVIKESTPASGGFASFFSLQAGSVMAASIIFGLALTSFFYNLSAPNPTVDSGQYASQYVVAYLFFVILFFGTMVVSIAAFKFNTRWVLIGACILGSAAVVWFIISILSFIPSIGVFKYVCVHNRCPPSVWLFEVYWRPQTEVVVVAHHGVVKKNTASRVNNHGTTTAQIGAKTTEGFTDVGGNIGGNSSNGVDGNFTTVEGNTTSITGNTTDQEGSEKVSQNPAIIHEFAEENLFWDGPIANDNNGEAANLVESIIERPRRMAFNHVDDRKANVKPHILSSPGGRSHGQKNTTNHWNWLLGMDSKRWVKPFVSSYVHHPEPGKIDSSLGMSIFCFIMLIIFWVYSLWTMFSHHKELKQQDMSEAELMRLNDEQKSEPV